MKNLNTDQNQPQNTSEWDSLSSVENPVFNPEEVAAESQETSPDPLADELTARFVEMSEHSNLPHNSLLESCLKTNRDKAWDAFINSESLDSQEEKEAAFRDFNAAYASIDKFYADNYEWKSFDHGQAYLTYADAFFRNDQQEMGNFSFVYGDMMSELGVQDAMSSHGIPEKKTQDYTPSELTYLSHLISRIPKEDADFLTQRYNLILDKKVGAAMDKYKGESDEARQKFLKARDSLISAINPSEYNSVFTDGAQLSPNDLPRPVEPEKPIAAPSNPTEQTNMENAIPADII